jgi:galactitol PTS system EIIA component
VCKGSEKMNLKMSQLVKPEHFFWNMKAKSDMDIISYLADQFYQKELVGESFKNSAIEREQQFPTGLATKTVGVAIPHTDVSHVIKNSIGIAVLKEPVEFRMMGIPESKVDVKVVFLLALSQPQGHLEVLKKLTGFFESDFFLPELISSSTDEEAFKRLADYLNALEGEI